ncbi:hypothetical protein ABKN59_011390 [Abortiporus biennis]
MDLSPYHRCVIFIFNSRLPFLGWIIRDILYVTAVFLTPHDRITLINVQRDTDTRRRRSNHLLHWLQSINHLSLYYLERSYIHTYQHNDKVAILAN